jgi:hypothetical protein
MVASSIRCFIVGFNPPGSDDRPHYLFIQFLLGGLAQCNDYMIKNNKRLRKKYNLLSSVDCVLL